MSEPQPNQAPNFTHFADWCLHKDSLSLEARHTVEELLERARTSDCYEAEEILSNYTELSLRLFILYRVSDLRPLSGLIKITELDLGLNRISDLSPLSRLTNLRKLRLDYNKIFDLRPLSDLTNLEELYIDGNDISDLSPLSKLKNLKILELKGNAIDNLSPLSELISLQKLSIAYNKISDISPLSELNNLTEILLGNNKISDLNPLSRLTNLSYLSLESNSICDLSPLSGLTNLYGLCIPYNQIADLSPISMLVNLGQIYLDCNRLSELNVVSGLAKLNDVRITQSEKPVYDLSWLPYLQSKWHYLLTLPINEHKAIESVKSAYKVIGIEEPDIIVFPSPKAGITYLKQQHNLGYSLVWEICYSISQRNIGLWFLMSSELQNKFAQEQTLNSLVEELLGDYDDIEDEYGEDNIEENIDNSEFNIEDSYITPENIVNAIAATELLIRELNYQLAPKQEAALSCLNQLFENCGWIFPYEKVCIVCDRPRTISLDADNRLHAEGEPAIEFSDSGHTGYYYHGVKIPEKYGKLHPQQWEAQWLLEEDNAELRRILIQGIGYDRICEQLQAQVIDSWHEYTLLRIDADVDVEPIHLLKMTCPSTAKIHTLRVPPLINSARVAIRWVNWDIDPEEFSVQT